MFEWQMWWGQLHQSSNPWSVIGSPLFLFPVGAFDRVDLVGEVAKFVIRIVLFGKYL